MDTGGNPLLQTSSSRQVAAAVVLVTFVLVAGTALYTPFVSGDASVILFTLSPVIAGFCGFLTWLSLDWPDRDP